jgi:hypothetical protein
MLACGLNKTARENKLAVNNIILKAIIICPQEMGNTYLGKTKA